MKMARASEQDLEAALTVSRIIEELEKGYMPGDDNAEETEFFDQDDPEHCKRALDAILSAAHQGSIFRVTFGMAVVLDPRNKLLDPDADTLELHPEHVRNADRASTADAQMALQYLADTEGAIESLTLDGKTRYRVWWPHMDERQAEWFESPLAAIAASQQQEG